MPTTAAGIEVEVRVPDDGRVFVPKEIVEAIGAKTGDLVEFRIIGPDTSVMRILGRMTLAEMVERFKADRAIDVKTAITEGEAAAADEALERMGLRRADG